MKKNLFFNTLSVLLITGAVTTAFLTEVSADRRSADEETRGAVTTALLTNVSAGETPPVDVQYIILGSSNASQKGRFHKIFWSTPCRKSTTVGLGVLATATIATIATTVILLSQGSSDGEDFEMLSSNCSALIEGLCVVGGTLGASCYPEFMKKFQGVPLYDCATTAHLALDCVSEESLEKMVESISPKYLEYGEPDCAYVVQRALKDRSFSSKTTTQTSKITDF